MKGNRNNNAWTDEEEIALLKGIKKHGIGDWKKILVDPKFADQLVDRTSIDLQDKWRNIEKIESEAQTLESASASPVVSNESSPNSSSDMKNESRYDEAISISSDENGSDLSEIKDKTETQKLESLSISPAMTEPSPNSSSDMNNESRYESMVFEALSTINDENGSRLSEILSFIEERHEVPQNFREILIYILASLVSERKLKKVRNRYKISITKATKPKLTLHTEDSAKPAELPSTSAILRTSKETQEIDAAANKIAEGIDKLAVENMVLYEEPQFRKLVSDCLKILVSEGKLEKVLDGYTILELVNKVLEVAPEVVAERVAEADNERSIAEEAVEEAERLVEESETMLQLSLEIQKQCDLGKELFLP
ncbi:Telomere repeat-binding factor 5 [Cardamine amara subsp. amara]|uniref:MYB transcription factor n=1 Tax=Cardamine amara subsp. amara TaxID=228776 RepID=A0ABD1BP87_CARAN